MSSSNFPIWLNKVNNQVITFYFYCLPLFLCFLLNLSATQTFIANPSVYHCVIDNIFLTVGFQLSSSNPTTSCWALLWSNVFIFQAMNKLEYTSQFRTCGCLHLNPSWVTVPFLYLFAFVLQELKEQKANFKFPPSSNLPFTKHDEICQNNVKRVLRFFLIFVK